PIQKGLYNQGRSALAVNSGALECLTCQVTTGGAKIFVESNVTRDWILYKLALPCAQLGVYNQTCADMTKDAVHFAFNTMKNLTASQICALFNVCRDAPKINLCPLCTDTVSHFKSVVFSQPVIQQVTNFAYGICRSHPATFLVCRIVMMEVVISAINHLRVTFDPVKICQ
ncbi:Saposin-like type B, region 1, partial [Opisthorchis viverrini]